MAVLGERNCGGRHLTGYVDLALRGGFPEIALRELPWRTRAAWLESYVDQSLTRDVDALEERRDPSRLRRYLEAYALNSAGVADDRTIFEAAGVDRKTAGSYELLLRRLFLVDAIPAWTTNRLKRLVKAPKRVVVEPALLAAVLRLDARAFLRDGGLLGRLLETFVLAQLRPEVSIADSRPLLYHLRSEGGRKEIDLLAEIGGRQVIGLEVKATAAPGPSDARHLAWLRDSLGESFVTGVVLHTGRAVYALDDRIVAAPISTIWG